MNQRVRSQVSMFFFYNLFSIQVSLSNKSVNDFISYVKLEMSCDVGFLGIREIIFSSPVKGISLGLEGPPG